jgi:hypothetical protein
VEEWKSETQAGHRVMESLEVGLTRGREGADALENIGVN